MNFSEARCVELDLDGHAYLPASIIHSLCRRVFNVWGRRARISMTCLIQTWLSVLRSRTKVTVRRMSTTAVRLVWLISTHRNLVPPCCDFRLFEVLHIPSPHAWISTTTVTRVGLCRSTFYYSVVTVLDGNVYAVIMAEPLPEFTPFILWMQNSIRWPPTCGPSHRRRNRGGGGRGGPGPLTFLEGGLSVVCAPSPTFRPFQMSHFNQARKSHDHSRACKDKFFCQLPMARHSWFHSQ